MSTKELKRTVCNTATKASGDDEVSAKVLKSSFDAATSSLTFIINNSLATDVVPARWKQAVVIPVYKSGNRSDPEVFYPIPLLPVVSNGAKRLVHQQLTTYLENNSFLHACQCEFRSSRSTEMTLLLVTEPILRGMDNHKFPLLCLLDWSKAFDCDLHRLLLDTLQRFGIDP